MAIFVSVLYFLAAALASAYALFELRLLARYLRYRSRILESVVSRVPAAGSERRNGSSPTVTIQIPLYNERTAAEQVIEAAGAQDYARDRFDIQVLDDSTDETCAIAARTVERLQGRGVSIRHLRRERRDGYKAGALAAGLERSDAEFVAIFDADFTPDPTFLRRLLIEESSFQEPDVAFVQTRWSFKRPLTGLFHSALSLLIDRHFFVQKPTKAFMGNVTVFNGSGGVWRREAIDAVGGWSADTLTEDLDLSYRCALAGWRGRYLHDVAVPNELPADMRAFKLQQHRWARGNAQVLRKLSGRVLRSGGAIRERWEEAHLLAGYAIHPVLLLNLLLWPFAVVLVDRTVFIVLQLLLSLFTMVAPLSFLLALRERGDRLSLASAVKVGMGVCLGIGLMVVNTVGQVQGFLSRRGEFARTPKPPRRSGSLPSSGPDEEISAAERPYTTLLHWTFFLELVMIGYCAASFAFLVEQGEVLWTPPLVFWGLCLGLVVHLQLFAGATPSRVTGPRPVSP